MRSMGDPRNGVVIEGALMASRLRQSTRRASVPFPRSLGSGPLTRASSEGRFSNKKSPEYGIMVSQLRLIMDLLQQQGGARGSHGSCTRALSLLELPSPSDTFGPYMQSPRRAIEMALAEPMELENLSSTFGLEKCMRRTSLHSQLRLLEAE